LSDQRRLIAVTKLGRADRGSAVAALGAAFWEYPESVHLLPNERHRRRVLPRYL
jgi:hypothetical protein